MKKRWQVLLSVVLVMVFSVSFSVPVCASSSDTWLPLDPSGASATVNVSLSSSDYFKIAESSQYLRGSSSSSSGESYYYYTGQIRYYYWRLAYLASTSDTLFRARVNDLVVSSGSFSGDSYGSGVFLIGSTSDVLLDQAVSVPFGGGTYYFDAGNDYIYLWYRVPVFYINSDSDFSASITYSYSGTFYSTLGYVDNLTDVVINQTQQQTDTLTTGYDNSGMESTNDKLSSSLTEYDNTESQVMDQSVQYIDAVTFFDPTTHLQLMSCITYTSTFLQNLFVALGDWSVLVLIALSLAFALMLIGWFKYRS